MARQRGLSRLTFRFMPGPVITRPSSDRATGLPGERPKRLFGGLITRWERWGFSWSGWLGTGLLILSAGGLTLFTIFPFLAVTQRIPADLLVVEGWIHDYAIRAV